jgi:hypothetical protein
VCRHWRHLPRDYPFAPRRLESEEVQIIRDEDGLALGCRKQVRRVSSARQAKLTGASHFVPEVSAFGPDPSSHVVVEVEPSHRG